MQLPSTKTFFNRKNVEVILKRESKFITELLSILPLPTTTSKPDDEWLLDTTGSTEARKLPPQMPNKTKTSRAKSLVELQARLEEMSSRRLSYKEQLLKKAIKSKIKRKGKAQKNVNKKEHVKGKPSNEATVKEEGTTESATVENSHHEGEDKMTFSKFDFSGIGKKKFRKEKHDPKKTLEDLQKQKEELSKLRQSGEADKAAIINEKVAWKNALAKSQGKKIKDDEQLLAKSIKKREQKRQHSKKKWEARQEGVKKAQDERQKKRQENIDKRKKTKKVNKMKKAVKKGKIIPGF